MTGTIARAIDEFAFIEVSAAHDPRTESEQRGRREYAYQALERVLAVLPAPPVVDEADIRRETQERWPTVANMDVEEARALSRHLFTEGAEWAAARVRGGTRG